MTPIYENPLPTSSRIRQRRQQRRVPPEALAFCPGISPVRLGPLRVGGQSSLSDVRTKVRALNVGRDDVRWNRELNL